MKGVPHLDANLGKYPEGTLREINLWLDSAVASIEELERLRRTIPSYFGSERRFTTASQVFRSGLTEILLSVPEMKSLQKKVKAELVNKRENREPSLIPTH